MYGLASNGQEALDLIKNSKKYPDVILMDHRMPIMTGIEASIEILKIEKKIRIIIISADNSIKEKAIEIGASFFLDKPFTIEHLIRTINNVLSFP